MSSDTDTTSSSRSSEERRRKIHKKLKNKLEKKSKKHKKDKKKKSRKEKKRSRKESSSEDSMASVTVQPIAPPRSLENIKDLNDFNNVRFGPALPPHLQKKDSMEVENLRKSNTVIGPTMPCDIQKYTQQEDRELAISPEYQNSNPPPEEEDEELKNSYGPLPISNASEMSAAQIELEKRALELKMAAIDGSATDNVDQTVREEWMLELPEVGLKGGLAALNNIKRGFYQGKDRPDFSDRSSWTKTPQTGDECQTKAGPSKPSKETLQSYAQALYEKQRDAEQEALAKKHKKKNKRDESLVELHQKKLRKEERRKAKELQEKGEKPERRPFSRDVDLKLNKIDSNQTKRIVDKAKILNTKFSSGRAKYL